MIPFQTGAKTSSFNLQKLQLDSNCIAIQDPSAVWGIQDFLPRRNLLTYSEDFSNAAWSKSRVSATASTVTQTAGQTTAGSVYVAVSVGAGGAKASFEAKSNGKNWCSFSFDGGATRTYFNVLSGTIGNVASGVTASILQSDDSYFICRASISSASTYFQVYLADSNGDQGVIDSGGIYLRKAQLTRADTLDQSYQRISDWETEKYAWAAAKNVPWLRRNRFLNTATLSTQTVSSVTASPITVSFKGTGTITFSTAYVGSLAGTGANDRVTATFTPSAGNLVCTVSGTVTEAQCENASAATEYQAIGASWDATYTAAAIAAGYPISLWQDSAGTSAVNGDNQAIGKMLDMKGTYTATQSTAANQPKWRLDANGKPYIERDLTNDSLPITLPTVLSDAQLGPELVTNGTFDSDTGWVKAANWTITGGKLNAASAAGNSANYTSGTIAMTAGKQYCLSFTVTVAAGSVYMVFGQLVSNGAYNSPVYSSGTYSYVLTGNFTGSGSFFVRAGSGGFTGTVDDVSFKEVTGTNVVYTAEQNVTLRDSGLILSGSYAPITPAVDYGRIIMAADSRYDAKIIKYLDQKRGRQYSLGPELVPALNFTTDWLVVGGGAAVSATSFSSTSAGGLQLANLLTVGKTYSVIFGYNKTDATTDASVNNANAAKSNTAIATTALYGVFGGVVSATSTYFYVRLSTTCTLSAVTLSVREVIL